MLLSNVFTKAIRDNVLMVVGILVILVGFSALMTGLFTVIGDDYLQLIKDMPEALRAIYGSSAASSTIAGLLASVTFSLLVPIIVLAYGIVGATKSAIGEEESGSLALLLAYPVSRRRMILSKAAATAIGILFVVLVSWLALELFFRLFEMQEQGLSILAASIQLSGLVLLFAGLALALGAWLGSSVLAIGITAILALVSYLASTMLPLVDGLQDLGRFSPWWLYSGAEALTRGVDVALLALALTGAVALTALAVVGLDRRDLKG